MKPTRSLVFGTLLCCLAMAGWAGEEEVVQAAKEIARTRKDAIVQVTLVLQMKAVVGGREAGVQEHKLEVNGTVVDPSGLAVISNTQTDPSSLFAMEGGEDNPGFKMETNLTSVKIVLADGKEYPAKVVLRDKDLDLAFVRPDEKGLTLSHIELKTGGAPPGMLDSVITLTRLDRTANREPAVEIARVMSVIRKPRVRYVLATMIEPGTPVFDRSGGLLGLALMRVGGSRGAGMSLMSMLPSVLPCEDILEVMKQVPPPEAAKEGKEGAADTPKK